MTNADHHFTPTMTPYVPGIVAAATGHYADDPEEVEGVYRSVRDDHLDVFSSVEIAEVEENAHNAAYYDAAEALDMK